MPERPPDPDGRSANDRLFRELLDRVMAKDLPGVIAMFHEDAMFYDPHFPEAKMVGRSAIERGNAWGMGSLEQFGFSVRRVLTDGDHGMAEVDTHHVIRGRRTTTFDQAFAFDINDGLFTRVQAYVPYRAHGLGGLIPRAIRVMWRLRGRRLAPRTLTPSA